MVLMKNAVKNPLSRHLAFGALSATVGFMTMSLALANMTHTVSEKGKKFSPSGVMEIGVGDTVKFVNDDDVDHNVMIKKMSFNSDQQKPGASNDVTFDASGKYKVRCAIHPKMKLTIVAK